MRPTVFAVGFGLIGLLLTAVMALSGGAVVNGQTNGPHIQDLIDAKPVLQSDVGNAILLTTIANLIATLEDLRESAGEL